MVDDGPRPDSLESTLERGPNLSPAAEFQPSGELPILPLRGTVVLPSTSAPLNIGQPRSVRLIDEASGGDGLVGLFASRDPEARSPGPDAIFEVGTVARIRRLLRQPDGTVRLMVDGLHRVRIDAYTQSEPFLRARVLAAGEGPADEVRVAVLRRNLYQAFLAFAQMVPTIPEALLASSLKHSDALHLLYNVASYVKPDFRDAQRLLETDGAAAKLEWMLDYLGQEAEVLRMRQDIRSRAAQRIEETQREFFLREQLKAIQHELGEDDERLVESREFAAKAAAAELPPEAERVVERELKRMTRLPVTSAEYGVVRNYLEWITSLPWRRRTEDNFDLVHAHAVLDEDHHGLGTVKDRIVEHLAVRRLRQQRSGDDDSEESGARWGTILCLVGPPGVGKTSLGRSIARAMGRRFARIALGGLHDEGEIKGHRRTYIGALPGRIIQSIHRAGSKNPVIMLDEIDKLGRDFRGDPGAALLEVLDPEQNAGFLDRFLDVPFDLSDTLFITTANYLDPIPGPLRDRLEVLQLPGYTEKEKVAIATDYLIPRQVAESSLRPDEVTFDEAAIRDIVRSYTREAGVRDMERQISRICRKVATAVATLDTSGQATESVVHVTADTLHAYLGPPQFVDEVALRTSIAGVATGLAWTSSGGSLIFVEASAMPGNKNLTITGQVGDVMRESALAALAYVRSHAGDLGLPEDFYDHTDLHIHVPAGAIPKDGPSAGLPIAVALASLFTGRNTRSDVALTGEITLRGQLLAVGGLKQKVLAAHSAGIRTVIIPEQNRTDITTLPREAREAVDILAVTTIYDAIGHALQMEHTNGKQK